jgi:hypothetical protein
MVDPEELEETPRGNEFGYALSEKGDVMITIAQHGTLLAYIIMTPEQASEAARAVLKDTTQS